MKFAIISDIHGNLPALQAVLTRIQEESCDEIVCLGDLVGYGPFPNECVETIRNVTDKIIIGNHDHAAIGLTNTTYFNPYAKAAIVWTQSVLTEETRRFLMSLQMQISENGVLFVHATPCTPKEWDYILNTIDAAKNFRCFREQVCFVGHSHMPSGFILLPDKHVVNSEDNPIHFSDENRYIINVGSVGQPRDGDARAAFAIYDNEQKTVELVRVPYDIEKVQEAMLKCNLPIFLIERLRTGR